MDTTAAPDQVLPILRFPDEVLMIICQHMSSPGQGTQGIHDLLQFSSVNRRINGIAMEVVFKAEETSKRQRPVVWSIVTNNPLWIEKALLAGCRVNSDILMAMPTQSLACAAGRRNLKETLFGLWHLIPDAWLHPNTPVKFRPMHLAAALGRDFMVGRLLDIQAQVALRQHQALQARRAFSGQPAGQDHPDLQNARSELYELVNISKSASATFDGRWGADVSLTPFHVAMKAAQPVVAMELLRLSPDGRGAGYDENAPSPALFALLHATYQGRTKLVKYLLDNFEFDAEEIIRGRRMTTSSLATHLLRYAARQLNMPLVRLLTKKGFRHDHTLGRTLEGVCRLEYASVACGHVRFKASFPSLAARAGAVEAALAQVVRYLLDRHAALANADLFPILHAIVGMHASLRQPKRPPGVHLATLQRGILVGRRHPYMAKYRNPRSGSVRCRFAPLVQVEAFKIVLARIDPRNTSGPRNYSQSNHHCLESLFRSVMSAYAWELLDVLLVFVEENPDYEAVVRHATVQCLRSSGAQGRSPAPARMTNRQLLWVRDHGFCYGNRPSQHQRGARMSPEGVLRVENLRTLSRHLDRGLAGWARGRIWSEFVEAMQQRGICDTWVNPGQDLLTPDEVAAMAAEEPCWTLYGNAN
ncbi:hypothetical protein MKZ38_002671 [Zalerion maritima]|uniref:Uncharacterized protein n=1 Tax=Zalerion maritima TaxID=339359 RepID=A0AAD5WQN9_9PEZI|nr:hypothetical protein MKZ38_002671 [Zalerion maritima]